MKKAIGILVILAVLTSASFGEGEPLKWKGNVEEKLVTATSAPDYVAVGETVDFSAAPWIYGSTVPIAQMDPWAGIQLSAVQTDGFIYQYTAEARMADQYGMTLNVDTDLGDGTLAGYRHGTSTTAVYNVLGKWSGKNGTVNMNGHTVWTDGFQIGTVARTSFNTDYPTVVGQYTMNLDGGSLNIMGSSQIGYGANVDTTMNISGSAVYSAIGAGKNTELGRSSAVGQVVNLNIDGSDATIDMTNLKMNSASTGLTQNIKFILDAGGASTVNVSGDLIMGADSRLSIELSAAPTTDPIVLFNLLDPTKVITGLQGGKFRDTYGGGFRVDNAVVFADFEGTTYYWRITYYGGTGNDVVLNMIPEPATLGLLSLGGLLLVRRRRA